MLRHETWIDSLNLAHYVGASPDSVRENRDLVEMRGVDL
jgi:hypothetical protein